MTFHNATLIRDTILRFNEGLRGILTESSQNHNPKNFFVFKCFNTSMNSTEYKVVYLLNYVSGITFRCLKVLIIKKVERKVN